MAMAHNSLLAQIESLGRERKARLDAASDETSARLDELSQRASAASPTVASNRITAAIGGLYLNDEYSDVVFQVKVSTEPSAPGGLLPDEDAKVVTFPGHKAVLAAGSSTFRRLLFGDEGKGLSKESSTYDDRGRLCIRINDCAPPVFSLLLQGLYSSRVDVTMDNFQAVLTAATTYNVVNASEACESFLVDGLTISTAWSMFIRSASLGMDATWGMEFICNNFQELVTQAAFLDISEKQLCLLLQDDTLVAPNEVDLFKQVVKWGEAELKRRVAAAGSEVPDLAGVLSPVVRHIRFPLMKLEHLSSVVAPSNVLTGEQLLQCFTYVSISDASTRAGLPMPFSSKARPARKRYIPVKKRAPVSPSTTLTRAPLSLAAALSTSPIVRAAGHNWTCAACTFENAGGRRCEMCDSARP